MDKITSIEFDVCGICNLECKYCYLERRNKDKFLKKETVDIFIEKYFIGNVFRERILVSFWGGEPFLNFEIIKYIVFRFNDYQHCYNSIHYRIISNGTIITEEDAKYCSENNISIQITIDGNQKCHDSLRIFKNGKGSFNLIMDNLKTLSENKVDFFIRSTLSSISPKPSETIKLFKEYSLENIAFGICTPTDSCSGFSITPYEARKFAEDLVKSFETGFYSSEFVFTQVEGMIMQLTSNEPLLTCGVGNKVTVKYDGTIYPCHRYVEYPELKIGDLSEPINLVKNYPNTLNTIDLNKECKTCSVRYFCGGTCFFEIQKRYNCNYYFPSECEFRRVFIKGILKTLIKFKTQDKQSYNKLFDKYFFKSLSTDIMARKKNYTIVSHSIVNKTNETDIINLENEGILYLKNQFDKKFIINATSLAIWQLIDGNRTAHSIAQEIATICEVDISDIEKDIYMQLATLQEIGFVEEVKETVANA